MEKIDGEDFKPRVLRNGKVLGSVVPKKPQRKNRKTNSKLAESESTSAGAPSDDVAAALPKPPKEKPRDDGIQEPVASQDVGTTKEAIGKRGAPKKSVLSVEHSGGSNVTKRARRLRIKEEPVEQQPEVESLAPKDTAGPLQSAGQQLPAAIVLDGRNSNEMQIRKDPVTSDPLQVSIKQERDERDEPSCSINPKRSSSGQGRVSKNKVSFFDHTLKPKDEKLQLKRGRKTKKYDLSAGEAATAEQGHTSAAPKMANTIEILCPNPGTSQTNDGGAATMETQQQKELISLTIGVDIEQISAASICYADEGYKKNDAVGEEVSIRAEKVMVSIPTGPNILAAIIKQEHNDESQESIVQQQCSSKSHRSIKQDQERVTKSTASTVDRTQKTNDKKVPFKRGRKPKQHNLPLTSETATDDSDAATMEMYQQPLYVSDSEEPLKISVVAEIPPQDNSIALQDSMASILDMTVTDHSYDLQLRKPFQRLMVREWFYSNIDQCLLGRGSGVQDMETLLSSWLPALTTRRLNRAAWNHIRGILRRLSLVQPQRRCSEKFFLDERIVLEQRREKVRFLQANPMFEYLDDDIPTDLPVSIESGDPVVAVLNEPYGVFRGVVENFDRPIARSYTVRFEDPAINGQIVPDINIASATAAREPKQEAEAEEIVMLPKNFSKQLELLKKQLDEKEKLLNEMEGLRIRYRSIPAHCGPHHTQALMEQHQQRYQVYIDNLQNVNNSIALLMRTITRFGLNVDEALIDKQVVQTGQHLQDVCNKAGNIPLGTGVLELTLRQLRGPPSRLKELQIYLQGNKFLQ